MSLRKASAQRTFFLLFCLLPMMLFAESPYSQPKSFSQAVNIYKKMDFDYTRTAFTDEKYVYDPTSCMDRFYVKGNERRTVSFVRIVPEERMYRMRPCGTQNICEKYNKERYSGARCCRLSDTLYQAYDRDLFNIIPIVDTNAAQMQKPPLHARGNIARIYLYMNAQYGLNLSYEEQIRYLRWHKQDAVDEKECSIYRQIVDLQGRINPWVEPFCKARVK